jgi:hypothetical protein
MLPKYKSPLSPFPLFLDHKQRLYLQVHLKAELYFTFKCKALIEKDDTS